MHIKERASDAYAYSYRHEEGEQPRMLLEAKKFLYLPPESSLSGVDAMVSFDDGNTWFEVKYLLEAFNKLPKP